MHDFATTSHGRGPILRMLTSPREVTLWLVAVGSLAVGFGLQGQAWLALAALAGFSLSGSV